MYNNAEYLTKRLFLIHQVYISVMSSWAAMVWKPEKTLKLSKQLSTCTCDATRTMLTMPIHANRSIVHILSADCLQNMVRCSRNLKCRRLRKPTCFYMHNRLFTPLRYLTLPVSRNRHESHMYEASSMMTHRRHRNHPSYFHSTASSMSYFYLLLQYPTNLPCCLYRFGYSSWVPRPTKFLHAYMCYMVLYFPYSAIWYCCTHIIIPYKYTKHHNPNTIWHCIPLLCRFSPADLHAVLTYKPPGMSGRHARVPLWVFPQGRSEDHRVIFPEGITCLRVFLGWERHSLLTRQRNKYIVKPSSVSESFLHGLSVLFEESLSSSFVYIGCITPLTHPHSQRCYPLNPPCRVSVHREMSTHILHLVSSSTFHSLGDIILHIYAGLQQTVILIRCTITAPSLVSHRYEECMKPLLSGLFFHSRCPTQYHCLTRDGSLNLNLLVRHPYIIQQDVSTSFQLRPSEVHCCYTYSWAN